MKKSKLRVVVIAAAACILCFIAIRLSCLSNFLQ